MASETRALRQWLSDADFASLCGARRAGVPFARPAFAARCSATFGWELLDRALRAEPLAGQVLVVRRAALLERAVPRDAAALRALFAAGAGVVIRRAERQEPALAALAASFEAAFSERAHIQLFATPGGTHGFGWHYDVEDVLILQTAGSKTYYFRENTQAPILTPDAQLDFTAIRTETSPLHMCSLATGDALYLPRGTWHMAKAQEDSLSISLGLR